MLNNIALKKDANFTSVQRMENVACLCFSNCGLFYLEIEFLERIILAYVIFFFFFF